jgi:hypothetical protein
MGLCPMLLKTKSVLIFTIPINDAIDAISEFNPISDFLIPVSCFSANAETIDKSDNFLFPLFNLSAIK